MWLASKATVSKTNEMQRKVIGSVTLMPKSMLAIARVMKKAND